MQYPGYVVKLGATDGPVVRAIKNRLNEALVLGSDPSQRLDPSNPTFGAKTKQVVKLFQSRHVDDEGRPLRVDGEVGSLTWSALFGVDSIPASRIASSELLRVALDIAAGEEARRVREVPVNSNRGRDVEAYLARTGLGGGYAWCCAFVYWCLDEAALRLGTGNPMVKTAGCLDHWNRAVARGATRIVHHRAVQDPGLLRAGMIFIMDYGSGLGHTGIIASTAGGLLTTIEGNTDASRTREGGGVYRLTRKVAEINRGYIDYSAV